MFDLLNNLLILMNNLFMLHITMNDRSNFLNYLVPSRNIPLFCCVNPHIVRMRVGDISLRCKMCAICFHLSSGCISALVLFNGLHLLSMVFFFVLSWDCFVDWLDKLLDFHGFMLTFNARMNHFGGVFVMVFFHDRLVHNLLNMNWGSMM